MVLINFSEQKGAIHKQRIFEGNTVKSVYEADLRSEASFRRENQLFSEYNQKMRCFSIYLFLYDALHVSDGFCVHHQEFKTAHTASGVCQTNAATCYEPGRLAAGSTNGMTNTWRCMCSFELLMMDGKTVWNM